MSNNNTQLPAEVVSKIKEQASFYSGHKPDEDSTPFRNGYYSGYISGATEYANKLHQLEEHFIAMSVSCEAQLEKIHLLQVKGNTLALALRRLSRSVSVHPEFSNASEWGDYVSGAEKAMNEWEGVKLTPKQIAERKAAIEWYRNPAAAPPVVRETIEDILLKTGRFNQEECSELADAILRDLPKEEEWDSERIIGRVQDRFKELHAKEWDRRSFYNGWLEGRSDMLQQIKGIGYYKPREGEKEVKP